MANIDTFRYPELAALSKSKGSPEQRIQGCWMPEIEAQRGGTNKSDASVCSLSPGMMADLGRAFLDRGEP